MIQTGYRIAMLVSGAGALLIAAALGVGSALGAEPAAVPPEVGLWQTFSDETGKPEGFIRISLVGDELRGVIERGMPGDDPNELCTKCPGDRKDHKMIGLTIISGVHKQADYKQGDYWSGGEVLDPRKGTTYRCKLRAIDSGRKLEMRGYIGFSLLGRTQTWVRAE